MYVLGISCHYHDASATLLKDGEVVAAADEERFTRKKHDDDFPVHAIGYCLRQAGITMKDVDCVGFYEKPLLKFERVLFSFLHYFPRSLPVFLAMMPSWLTEKLRIPETVRKKLGWKGRMVFIRHHESHAASAFFPSPFQEAAILTVDGVGEWTTAAYGVGRGNQMELWKEMRFPHSLGLFYSMVTGYLGFKVNSDEYKVMGLAGYGKPVYYEKMKQVFRSFPDGSYENNLDYFDFMSLERMFSARFEREFGRPRKPGERVEQHHIDLACSLQQILEESMVALARHVQKETGLKKLCMAGGVALNCVANARILKEAGFDELYVQPAAGDSGGSMGVAFHAYHHVLGRPRSFVLEKPYLGPGYSPEEIRAYLEANRIRHRELSVDGMLGETARLIQANHIVGWFQGRMEWGPRALGCRSILANAMHPDMKDILNSRVKHREDFRPFAPAALLEEARDYFEIRQPDPFMVLVCDVKKGKQKLLPSITHIDGTARLQTVDRKINPLFHALIREFKKLTGVPVVINTSFNVKGEPIVCSPHDAFKCFAGTGIDFLVMDRFIIDKKDIS
ncbi:MAG TPA: carbamoyltransferase, partial [Candidatus Diapherotrites archaeon]|nr:carbamoyltransferase [Candidatus Diapherotrites archaeon]